MTEADFSTAGGVAVRRVTTDLEVDDVAEYATQIESRVGGMFVSGVDYPGRYTRWDIAYVDPPISIEGRGRRIEVRALTARGHVLIPAIATALGDYVTGGAPDYVLAEIPESTEFFSEEDRIRQPSVFSALRRILNLFASDEDENLGLYGAFGYDLTFQLDPIRLKHERDSEQRDFVLHLPDEISVIDRASSRAWTFSYDFTYNDQSTIGQARSEVATPPIPKGGDVPAQPREGYYAEIVEKAVESFARGDLFEVVPGQAFYARCESPAEFSKRLLQQNPAPYGFFLNLGAGEYLVGASPEMYVRVDGDRVETCPIAGTIARGNDPIEDAANIKTLLESAKDESELTMCTDVDRNDKARVCVPGTVRVIGRRQIEMYSRLIHTVDHVEGVLRPECDALDAFLTHTWAVTVTGAPKHWAMQFIEDHEEKPRRWYGGAVGMVKFNGSLNTGLTLRTAQIKDGVAEVRAGATLLFDSDPAAEEAETRLKASALLRALEAPGAVSTEEVVTATAGEGVRVLLVDNDDSFVHTLADYMRRQGADVTTVRYGFPLSMLTELAPDLVVLSPGPGKPSDFGSSELLAAVDAAGVPVFGVCLGLQSMVEYCGGTLGQLDEPVHGKASKVSVEGDALFAGMDEPITTGRYHSLFADPATFPSELRVTATTEDDVIMAIEHESKPMWAVQFHPESIMSLDGNAGARIISNVFELVRRRQS